MLDSFSELPDFDTADALLISEVKMLLEHRKAQYESQDDDHDLSEVFTKTLEYCQTFSKYNSKESIKVSFRHVNYLLSLFSDTYIILYLAA